MFVKRKGIEQKQQLPVQNASNYDKDLQNFEFSFTELRNFQ